MAMTNDLSSLTIVAADREQTITFRRRTYLQWGVRRGLTLEQYLARVSQMDSQEHAIDGRKTRDLMSSVVSNAT